MNSVKRLFVVTLMIVMTTSCAWKSPVIVTADGLVRIASAGVTLLWFGVDTTVTSISRAVLDENGEPIPGKFVPDEYLTAHSTPTMVKFMEAALAAGGQIGASIFLGKRRFGGCTGDCSPDFNLNSSSLSESESRNNNISTSDLESN